MAFLEDLKASCQTAEAAFVDHHAGHDVEPADELRQAVEDVLGHFLPDVEIPDVAGYHKLLELGGKLADSFLVVRRMHRSHWPDSMTGGVGVVRDRNAIVNSMLATIEHIESQTPGPAGPQRLEPWSAVKSLPHLTGHMVATMAGRYTADGLADARWGAEQLTNNGRDWPEFAPTVPAAENPVAAVDREIFAVVIREIARDRQAAAMTV